MRAVPYTSKKKMDGKGIFFPRHSHTPIKICGFVLGAPIATPETINNASDL
jgi:hypothetical protein